MDLKGYFKKVRELEEQFPGKDVLVISRATPDGGKEGVATLAPKRLACQLIVDGKARAASEAEAAAYEKEQAARRSQAVEEEMASRVHVQIVTDRESRRAKSGEAAKD
jgi:hypothetical protein